MDKFSQVCKGIVSEKILTDSKIRLICFPSAAGSSVIYKNWSKQLEQYSIEVFCVDLSKLNFDKTKFVSKLSNHSIVNDDIGLLMLYLIEILQPYLIEKPFAIFGHSFGSILER
eukprot:TRINITY_DN6539_c0_g1_i1.p1 TRINITY_DN6539_c0_g1~~TRINITY_DN6539_c0_g1_i1.p1  ORF type:complete len:114 (-),score=19.05 TRINITY_DN6539_c0_g1_i1:30-371(-)